MRMAQTTTRLPSIEVRDLPSVKHVKVFRNDDFFFYPRQVNVNQRKTRTFDCFLDDLNDHVHLPKGAVRKVFTPGGSRVTGLDQLEDGRNYIAAGNEPYRRIPYTDIESRPRRPQRARIDDQILPVVHSRFRNISGRYKKIKVEGKTILIHVNGDEIRGPRVVLLNTQEQNNWTAILNAVYERIKFDISRPLERLYTVEGEPILDPSELHSNHPYVAVTSNDFFRPCSYGLGKKNLLTSPRLDKRFATQYARKYKSSQGTPESSVASNTDSLNTYGSRSRRVVGQGNSYFHARPVKHKRTPPDKALKNLSADRDRDGVFKAKNMNRATLGAREVQENQDTRVDLPIDQVEAEEVKTEMIDDKPKLDDKPTIKSPSLSPPQSPADRARDRAAEKKQENEAATKIQANYRGYKARQDVGVLKKEKAAEKALKEEQKIDTLGDDKDLSAREQQERTERENQAATKIQANYRGHAVRSKMKEQKQQEETTADEAQQAEGKGNDRLEEDQE